MKTVTNNTNNRLRINLIKIKIFVCVLIFGISLDHAFAFSETEAGLEMDATVKQAKISEKSELKQLDSTKITVYNEASIAIRIYYTDKKGNCIIKLPLNRNFLISFTKKGWLTKSITVDTRTSSQSQKSFRLPVLIDLCRDIPELDASVLRNPIARVVYDNYLEVFYYGYIPSSEIAVNLRKLYRDYYQYYSNSVNQSDFSRGAIIYKVQLITLSGILPQNAKFFRNCGKAEEHLINNKYYYTVGDFSTDAQAEKKSEELKRKGYNDAFVVAFLNGRLVPVNETLAIVTK